MKFFVPAVGYRIELVSDWRFDLYHESRNDTLLKLEDPSAPVMVAGSRWNSRCVDGVLEKGFRRSICIFPAGTVLEVDRVYVRTMNKTAQKDDDFDSITFKVIKHPVFDTKKKIRFWAKLDCVNQIEYELPPDHTIGKDVARENAKKPKTLTAQTIRGIVSNMIYASGMKNGLGGGRDTPTWFTKDVAKQLKAIEVEWNRLRSPWEENRANQEQARRLAELEHQIKTGTLNLPLAYAGKVNCVEDLKTLGLYEHYFNVRHNRKELESWTYLVPYTIMSYGASAKFERMSDGTGCRTWRPAATNQHSWDADAPDMTHIWVKVFTDNAGLEIVGMSAGFDARE